MGLIGWYLNWCDRNLPGYARPDPERPDTAPCARCDEVIETDDLYCPACGNCPYLDAKWNGVMFMLAGLILSITVIGAIIGIPLFLLGILQR